MKHNRFFMCKNKNNQKKAKPISQNVPMLFQHDNQRIENIIIIWIIQYIGGYDGQDIRLILCFHIQPS